MENIKVIGHRGARGLSPENTLASIDTALEHQVDEIEIDIRVTKDGIPVLTHDAELKHPSGSKSMVSEQTYEHLKSISPGLTTLAEAAQRINRQVPLMIEVKPGEQVENIAKTIKDLLERGWQAEDFAFSSFDQDVLVNLNNLLPEVKKVVIERRSRAKAIKRAAELQTDMLVMNHRFLTGRKVSRIKKEGYKLYPYTMNNPKRVARLGRRGIAGFYTDYPDRFKN